MIHVALISLCSSVLASPQESTQFTFEAPSIYVSGQSYPVTVEIQAGGAQAPVAAWLLNESAFMVDGQSIRPRTSDQFLTLPAGAKMNLEFDLAPFLNVTGDFQLSYGTGDGGAEPIQVSVLEPAPSGIDFMTVDQDQLDDYMILVVTNRGSMLWELWPEVAPGHVRNFLDLYSAGFYDKTLFHRVGKGFMIQGGDPNTKDPAKQGQWGMGNGPRRLQAEFSDKKHLRGTLSTARGGHDINSGSSQFFVMHADYPSLDGQYTVFGQLYPGHAESFATLDRIANASGTPIPGSGGIQPAEPQRIERGLIVLHPNADSAAQAREAAAGSGQ